MSFLTAILAQSESTLLILGTPLLKIFNSMYGVSEKNERRKKKYVGRELGKNFSALLP